MSEPIPIPPDVLGREGRLAVFAGILGSVQRELFTLEVEALANGWEDETVLGGGATVATRRRDLNATQINLLQTYPDLGDGLRAREQLMTSEEMNV